MRERRPGYDIVASPNDEPITLAGPPDALSGRVELHNPGDAKVVLRQAALTDASGLLGPRPVHPTLQPVVLRPAQGRSVPLTVALDPATPPGEYRCELDLAGSSRSAILHVTERFELDVSPEVIVVENRPREVQAKKLVVRNLGNVPFSVGDVGEVMLDDETIWCRALRSGGLAWSEREGAGLEDLFVSIFQAGQKEEAHAGNLLVRNVTGDVEVAPGRTVSLDLEITVPERLHGNSRYRAVTPLFTEDLVFLVVPARGAHVGTHSRRSSRPRREKGEGR